MRSKRKDLDVDFIGGIRPLTKEDEMAISEFIKANKLRRARANEKSVLQMLKTFVKGREMKATRILI